jgi:hypothetical protein
MINLTKLTNRKMENQKKLTDAEILIKLNAVKLTKNGSLYKMQIQVSNEYLHILEGRNGIIDMAARITQAFPVSYKLYSNRTREVFYWELILYCQKNIITNGGARPKSNLEDFAVIPGALLRIELLEQILLRKKNP